MRYAEDAVQESIVLYLRASGFLFTSTGAGLVKSMRTQQLMNRLGYRKGTPDIIVWIPSGTLCIECKRPAATEYNAKTNRFVKKSDAGRQSKEQKEFETRLSAIGNHHYIVATSVDTVVKYIIEKKIKPI